MDNKVKRTQTKQVRLVQDKCKPCPNCLCSTLVKSYPNLFNCQTTQSFLPWHPPHRERRAVRSSDGVLCPSSTRGGLQGHQAADLDLERDGFSENPFYHCVIAEVPEQHRTKGGHTKIGYTTYFYNYNTWCGRTIHMGDLYVMPEFRGKGIGRALMSKVAQLGLAAGCHQLNFTIFDWNKSAQDFYLRQGCIDITASTGKHFMRCEGEALERLARP
ncbi:thialysine N-epsilon-acetyltransferase-like isoform X1 [Acanthopagrus latus]|uniref:thialysine N-epsilon-acetyltransferase-like isoform X1 n=1 Tax=Acanthopagrus latus TaxID=8177 RepID=UPI00187BDA74|nr:thialysine N-epsilon-acetyltransferase-like isoform X1 [Acanthopagrus latus]